MLAAFYLLASTYAVTYFLSRLLVIGYAPFSKQHLPAGPSAIVVLGSGSFTAKDWDEQAFSIVDPSAAARVAEAARVYRLTQPLWVISSGGKVRPTDPGVATALSMRDALVQLGVPPGRIMIETQSRNTHEEAVVVGPMLKSLGVAHTILVTSDVHMRRSVGAFRARGIETIPAIARHPFVAQGASSWIVPSDVGLFMARTASHEGIGIVYYWMRGWWLSAAPAAALR